MEGQLFAVLKEGIRRWVRDAGAHLVLTLLTFLPGLFLVGVGFALLSIDRFPTRTSAAFAILGGVVLVGIGWFATAVVAGEQRQTAMRALKVVLAQMHRVVGAIVLWLVILAAGSFAILVVGELLPSGVGSWVNLVGQLIWTPAWIVLSAAWAPSLLHENRSMWGALARSVRLGRENALRCGAVVGLTAVANVLIPVLLVDVPVAVAVLSPVALSVTATIWVALFERMREEAPAAPPAAASVGALPSGWIIAGVLVPLVLIPTPFLTACASYLRGQSFAGGTTSWITLGATAIIAAAIAAVVLAAVRSEMPTAAAVTAVMIGTASFVGVASAEEIPFGIDVETAVTGSNSTDKHFRKLAQSVDATAERLSDDDDARLVGFSIAGKSWMRHSTALRDNYLDAEVGSSAWVAESREHLLELEYIDVYSEGRVQNITDPGFRQFVGSVAEVRRRYTKGWFDLASAAEIDDFTEQIDAEERIDAATEDINAIGFDAQRRTEEAFGGVVGRDVWRAVAVAGLLQTDPWQRFQQLDDEVCALVQSHDARESIGLTPLKTRHLRMKMRRAAGIHDQLAALVPSDHAPTFRAAANEIRQLAATATARADGIHGRSTYAQPGTAEHDARSYLSDRCRWVLVPFGIDDGSSLGISNVG